MRAGLPDAVIKALFARLAAMYGGRWADLWIGADRVAVERVWAEELADVSMQQMKLALGALEGPHPPSLPEFRSLCKKFRSAPMASVTYLKLPRQKVAAETFHRLHDIIGKGRPKEDGDVPTGT